MFWKRGLFMLVILLLSGCSSMKFPFFGDSTTVYQLVFKGLTDVEMEDAEDRLLRLPGYENHQLLESKPQHNRYQYHSTLSSVLLNRKLRLVLTAMQLDGQVTLVGEQFTIQLNHPANHQKATKPDPLRQMLDRQLDQVDVDEVKKQIEGEKHKNKWKRLGEKLKDSLGEENMRKLKAGDWDALDF